ncbi:MAG: OmpA family protein [Aureispira sp.]|nr:OmpA family protein [Aureispira sp.]
MSRSILGLLWISLVLLNVKTTIAQNYQPIQKVPTAIFVENAYNAELLVEANITIKQRQTNGRYQTIGTYETDSVGAIDVALALNATYTLTTKKTNFYTQITSLSTKGISRTQKNRFGISLRPKDCYRLQGKVQLPDSILTKEEAYLSIQNTTTKDIDNVRIYATGKYYTCGKCSQTYTITLVVEGFVPTVDTITLPEENCHEKRSPLQQLNIQATPFVSEVISTPKAKGRYAKGDSVVIEDLVFKGKTNQLETKGNKSLEQLYKSLLEYPELIVELHIHTDSRKSHRYNRILAEKRGAYIEKFLLEKGIKPKQFTIVAKGEDDIANRCKNGVRCSAEEHRFNNRVEMKVIQGDKDLLSAD